MAGKVALKVLKPELAAVVGAERFLAEIKTTATGSGLGAEESRSAGNAVFSPDGTFPPEALESLGYERDYWPFLYRMWPEVRANLSEEFATYVERRFGSRPDRMFAA